ncbi:hypothetical protein DSTSK_19370 [Desulforhabdus sp. TSK]|nr:hypothetical protein DSTSK_19370 [Desulforhabdus sp. TSK]
MSRAGMLCPKGEADIASSFPVEAVEASDAPGSAGVF